MSDGGEELGLHGPHSNTGATIESIVQPRPHEGLLEMSVTGSIKYGAFYGPCVELRRTIRSTLGSNVISISDDFYNAGNQDVPHAWLLHINLGYPLIDTGGEFCYDASRVDPIDTETSRKYFRAGVNYKRIVAPSEAHRGSESLVAYLYPKPKNGRVTVGVINRKLGLGLAIHYSVKEFPRCGNWQHWGPREYVAALEPMNGGVEGRDKDRANGWLDSLEVGAHKSYHYEIEVVGDREGLDRLRKLNHA